MLENEESSSLKRFITKISKLDENNQCGYAIAKSMPTNYDKKDHFLIVDTYFRKETATLMYNQAFCPIFQEKKLLDLSEKCTLQLSKIAMSEEKQA